MPNKVLSIGNCDFDNGSLHNMLQGTFQAELKMVEDLSQAERLLRTQPFALVIVNRKLEVDGSEGLEVIRALKQQPEFADLPLMLLTNYPEYAAQAEAIGAVPGFGKATLNSPQARERLAKFLS